LGEALVETASGLAGRDEDKEVTEVAALFLCPLEESLGHGR
jgi:hypothetical protein